MRGACLAVSGLLLLLAGGVLVAFGAGMLAGSTVHLVAGSSFAILGIGALAHGADLCPKCKANISVKKK